MGPVPNTIYGYGPLHLPFVMDWVNQPPATMIPGQSYSLSWNVTEGATVDQANFQYAMLRDPLSSFTWTTSQEGPPRVYSQQFVAPSVNADTTYYFVPFAKITDGYQIRTYSSIAWGTGDIAQGAPLVTLSPGFLSFPAQPVGTAGSDKTLTLTNNGDAPLGISGIGTLGADHADFNVTGTSCPLSPNTLAAAADCNIYVDFAPTAGGSRKAAVTVNDNAGGSHSIPSTGGCGTRDLTACSQFWFGSRGHNGGASGGYSGEPGNFTDKPLWDINHWR